jgi:hypothetical protein
MNFPEDHEYRALNFPLTLHSGGAALAAGSAALVVYPANRAIAAFRTSGRAGANEATGVQCEL